MCHTRNANFFCQHNSTTYDVKRLAFMMHYSYDKIENQPTEQSQINNLNHAIDILPQQPQHKLWHSESAES